MINGSGFNMSQNVSVDRNAWIHVASTLEPKSGGGFTGKLYINGQLISTRHVSYTNLNTSIYPLELGYWDQWYLKGRLDDVTLYHDTLTETEIQDLMANGPSDLQDPNLKLYYSFDADTVDFQTNTVTDLSPQGNDGTISGGVSLARWFDTQSGQTEVVDHALDFDGTGKVTIPDDPSLKNNANMTIAFWVRDLRGPGTINRILSKGFNVHQDLDYGFQLWNSNDKLYRYQMINGSGFNMSQNVSVDRNAWIHVASTLEPKSGGGFTGKLYINGQLAGTRHVSYTNLNTSTYPLELGYWDQWYLKGRLDDVTIYHDTLTETEIQDLMANGPSDLQDPNLKLYYSFDADTVDFQTNTVTDLSPQGNDGTISGGVSLVMHSPEQVDYTHDFASRRISQSVNGTVTDFVYDGAHVLVDLDANGNVLRKYIHGPGVDEVLAIKRSSTTHYLTRDGLNSVTEATDTAGAKAESYTYDIYGAVSIFDASGNPITASAINNRYLYTGREWEPETDLYYYRARHYDPTIGRFLQPDPIGYDDGMNMYEYVGNNPVTWIDPLGQCQIGPNGGVTPCEPPEGEGEGTDTEDGDGLKKLLWERIRDNARDKVGSKEYAKDVEKDEYGEGKNKCNKFVCDVLEESGVSVPKPNGWWNKYPPTASQWADPNYDIPGFSTVDTPQAGDVAAVQHGDGSESNATGHVGIVSDANEGTTVSATSTTVVENDWGFRSGQNPTFKRANE